MLDIGQIREMCREVKDTTCRTDNSLKELVTEMRAMRRQEAALMVQLLAVNRTLMEVKRDNHHTLLNHCDQKTSTQRPFRRNRSPEQIIDQDVALSPQPHIAPVTKSTDDNSKRPTNTERLEELKETDPTSKLSEQLKADLPSQDNIPYSSLSSQHTQMELKEYLNSEDSLQISEGVHISEEHFSTSPERDHSDNFPENNEHFPKVCDLMCSCRNCCRRDSGYASQCSDLSDIDAETNGSCKLRSRSTSSFESSLSTL